MRTEAKKQNPVPSLDKLSGVARYVGSLPKQTQPDVFDGLGLKGKDCPCAPR